MNVNLSVPAEGSHQWSEESEDQVIPFAKEFEENSDNSSEFWSHFASSLKDSQFVNLWLLERYEIYLNPFHTNTNHYNYFVIYCKYC